MTELSTAPTTSPANSYSGDTAPLQEGASALGVSATASTATVLDALAPAGWKTLHHQETAEKNPIQVDHLAIGPAGIFVIDAHSWTPTTDTAAQNATLSDVGALANQIRTLLPPLTRQYVVPLLTFVDASPMSMLRGSIQVCTASMLQSVITSRRPVLSAGEVEDAVASLSSGLRTSSRVAATGPSPSAAPTRRGFLRKSARNASEAVAPPVSPEPAAAKAVAPPVLMVEPPAAVVEPPAPIVEPPAPIVEPPAPVVEPPAALVEPLAAVAEPTAEPEPTYWPEPEPTATPDLPPAAAVETFGTFQPETIVVEPDSEYWPTLPPTESAATAVATDESQDLGDEIEDLAHPVIPTGTSWDLAEEPPLEADAPSPWVCEQASEPPLALEPGPEPAPATADEPPADAPAAITSAPVEQIQPSLSASALTAGASTTEPAISRQAGGRRKAPVSKSGMSRILPIRASRAPARGGRRSATTASDGDSSQEGDLDRASLLPSPLQPVDIAVPDTAAVDILEADPPPSPVTTEDEFAAQAPVEPEPIAIALPTETETEAEPERPAAFQPDPLEPPASIESFEPTYTSSSVSSTVAVYDFDELEEPLASKQRRVADEQIEDDEPPKRKQKKVKTPRKPRLRRSKNPAVNAEADVDLSEMPANLSERGRQMYVEMQRRPKVDPTPTAPVQTGQAGRAGAIRKLFVFCVIGGAIGISSSHYDEINAWVSTHVEDLPGLNKIDGPPVPEKPNKAKDKKVKAKADQEGNGQRSQ